MDGAKELNDEFHVAPRGSKKHPTCLICVSRPELARDWGRLTAENTCLTQ